MSAPDCQAFYEKAMSEYRNAVMELESADEIVEAEAEKYPIRQIFHDYLDAVMFSPDFSPEQKKAAACISKCKTPEMGMNASYCTNCHKLYLHYASCNNRNCPCCQHPSQMAWIEQRKNEVIPNIPYYHVILTVPHLLNDLILTNQKILLDRLFRCSSEAVIELCQDKRFLGSVPGIVSILHTWSQKLRPHFHIHMILSGGGLDSRGNLVSLAEKQGKAGRKPESKATEMSDCFFLPMQALTRLFRGKMMDAVNSLMLEGSLRIPTDHEDMYLDPWQWNTFCSKAYTTEWVGKIVQTFQGRGNAIEYLARYTFKTAICNNRIASYDGRTVTIYVSDRESGVKKEYSMDAMDFISRFLTHVLPKGFTRVRYYGLLSNSRKTRNLTIIYLQLNKEYTPSAFSGASKSAVFMLLFHQDFTCCSCCGQKLIRLPRGRPMR